MSCEADGDGLRYASERLHRGASKTALQMTYRPTGPVELARPETLDAWLTERYCLYAERRRRLFRGEIHHAPWPLHQAHVHTLNETLIAAAGIDRGNDPPLAWAPGRIEVDGWALQTV